jgi:peptidoglycan/xylan/chitin deacetylase (PgdA/CDA1 family)
VGKRLTASATQSKRVARFLAKFVLYNSAAHLPLILRAGHRRTLEAGSLRILMYHKISPELRPDLSVRTESFRRQQGFLAEHFNIISLDQVESSLGGGAPLPTNAVLLTFDDGYRNNLSEAYPILKEFGHRALMFVPTDYVGGRTLNHDCHLVHPDPVLSWSEIKSMLDVFEVGSHSCSHRILKGLPREAVMSEVRTSKQILETSLGVPVRAFAYPNGRAADFDDAIERIVSETGYRFCFTTVTGINPPRMNPLRLLRYGVEDFGMSYFRRVLDGSADVLGLQEIFFGPQVRRGVNRVLGLAD